MLHAILSRFKTPTNLVEFKSTADIIKFLAGTNYFKMDRNLDRAIRFGIERDKARLSWRQCWLRDKAHDQYYEFLFSYTTPIWESVKLSVWSLDDVLYIECKYDKDKRLEIITEIYNNWGGRFEIMNSHIKAYKDAMEAKRPRLS